MAEAPPKPMPPDFEELEFSVESEEWNEYELKDGTVIRARVVLTKLHRSPYDPKNFQFKLSQPVWVVYAPYSSRGGTNVKPGEKVEGPKFEVHVNRSHEPWNVYRIMRTGQRLKIKLEVTEVRRYVDKYDEDGLPVYEVPNGVNIAMMPPEASAKP